MEKVYFVELARQVVCEFLDGGLEARYQIVFDSSQESETASIMGDEALLKRALYNLIQNSVIHNPKGCVISVSVAWNGNNTVITVSDNGIGVSAEKLDKLRATTNHLEKRIDHQHGPHDKLIGEEPNPAGNPFTTTTENSTPRTADVMIVPTA